MMNKLIFLFFTSFAFAGFQNHIKKAENKGNHHFIKNVDFIYMINLDKRPEKFEKSYNQLESYGIYPYRFSAVNGWELTLQGINDLGLKYRPGMKKIMSTCYPMNANNNPRHELFGKDLTVGYFCHCFARGTLGCFLSHLSVLQDAYDSGYKTVWIMEDDIEIIQNPHLISNLIKKLDKKVGKKNWDILFTDRDTKNSKGEYVPCKGFAEKPNFSPKKPSRFHRSKKIGKNFRQIGARYGAYSFIIRRSGIKKILDFVNRYNIYLPYDMEFYLPNDIKLYSVRNDVVSTRINAKSDNGSPPPETEEKNNE